MGFLSNHTQCDVLYGDTIMKDGCDVSVFKGDMMLINRRMPFAHQSCFVKVSEFKKCCLTKSIVSAPIMI